MYLIVPVDDRMGMAFNKRRQSQDRVLREYLMTITKGRLLRMNHYSGELFGAAENIRVSEDFLQQAGDEDFCYVENLDPRSCYPEVKALVLCRWNRAYPGDLHFSLDFSQWKLCYAEEFPGSSHEKITVEVYKP